MKKWIAIYLGGVSCVFIPLINKGNYFGLIDLKAKAYLYAAVPAVALMLVIAVVEMVAGKQKKGAAEAQAAARRPDIAVILPTLFGISAIISSLLSASPRLSLWGSGGWWVGSIMMAVLAAGTIIVSKYFEFHAYMMLPVMATNVVINILAMVQSAGYNPFGLLDGIVARQRYDYLSTIGNCNCYSGFLCLTLPLFWGAFMLCKERLTKVIYGVVSFWGFVGIIMATADSTIVGLGICTMFMLPFAFRQEQYLKRAGALVAMYGFCLLAVRYCPLFSVKISRTIGLSSAMMKSPVAELILVCGVLVYLFAGKILGEGKSDGGAHAASGGERGSRSLQGGDLEGRGLEGRGKYILIALELLLIGAALFMAVRSVLTFDDAWGSRRGMIWRVGWEQFCAYSPLKKLVGAGPEMLFMVFNEMNKTYGRSVVTAHCEPLQILLAQGLVGLAIYIAFWAFLLSTFFKKKVWTKSDAVFFFPLAAYWGQSLFCTIYPLTAVVLSFTVGAYLKNVQDDQPGGGRGRLH